MLKNRDRLLCDIAAQLGKVERVALVHVRVRLFGGDEMVKEYLGLAVAIAQLAEGLYWDDEGDWRNADRVVVDTY